MRAIEFKLVKCDRIAEGRGFKVFANLSGLSLRLISIRCVRESLLKAEEVLWRMPLAT